ncbi:hypothetical protein AVEN_61462-1, partial [Araneus ventricosus]
NGFRDYHRWSISHQKGVSGNESYERLSGVPWGRGGLVARSRPRDRRAAGPKPDSTEDPPCMGPVAR